MVPNSPNLQVTPSDWFGRFYGARLTHEEAEILALSVADRGLLRAEPELMEVKWFDYRRLHPTIATYLCAHAYNVAYKRMVRKVFDRGMAVGAKAFKGGDGLGGAEARTMWRLRQAIDQLGMRYDLFFNEALDWYSNSFRPNVPRPAQILSKAEVFEYVQERVADMLQTSLIVAGADPIYRVENWMGLPCQLAHEDFVIEQLRKKGSRRYAVESALYRHGVVRVERVIQDLGIDCLSGVLDGLSIE